MAGDSSLCGTLAKKRRIVHVEESDWAGGVDKRNRIGLRGVVKVKVNVAAIRPARQADRAR